MLLMIDKERPKECGNRRSSKLGSCGNGFENSASPPTRRITDHSNQIARPHQDWVRQKIDVLNVSNDGIENHRDGSGPGKTH